MLAKQQYELVIFEVDVDAAGTLAPGAAIHIARHLVGTGRLTIVGCGRQSQVRYRLPFNRIDWHEQSGLLCPSCLRTYRERELTRKLENARLAPSSNTGVTS